MKKGAKVLLCVLIAAICFLSGLFVGRNTGNRFIALMQSNTIFETEAAQDIDFRLDINSASKIELMELHGIGELLAERIIAYREENGPFTTVDDLICVKGIGEKKLQDIIEWIKVGG